MPAPLDIDTQKVNIRLRCDDVDFINALVSHTGGTLTEYVRDLLHRDVVRIKREMVERARAQGVTAVPLGFKSPAS